jgi:hypothetical protein
MHKENILKLIFWSSIDQEMKLKFEYSFEWIGWEIGDNTRKIFYYTKYMCVKFSIINNRYEDLIVLDIKYYYTNYKDLIIILRIEIEETSTQN